jgi:hypothetical protein
VLRLLKCDAECRYVNVVMLSVVMLSVVAPIKSIFYDFSYFIEGATEKVHTFLKPVSLSLVGQSTFNSLFFPKTNCFN